MSDRRAVVISSIVVSSLFFFPLFLFFLEYLLIPMESLRKICAADSEILCAIAPGVAFRQTHDTRYLYFIVYLLTMIPACFLNMTVLLSYFSKRRNPDFSFERDDFVTSINRFLLLAAFPALLLAFPKAYAGGEIVIFPPGILGILSYSFFYFGFCFFTFGILIRFFWSRRRANL